MRTPPTSLRRLRKRTSISSISARAQQGGDSRAMPKIVDIIEIAESMQTGHVLVVPKRCSAVRHRKSSCRRCVDACISGAVALGFNEVSVDPNECVGCGACTAVCPTEALLPLSPTDDELLANLAVAVENLGEARDTAVISCARIASKRMGDPEKFAEVPCLGRVEESLFVQLAAHGVTDIVLVDGTCRTCKHRDVVPVVDDAVDAANEIFAVMGSSARVRRISELPEAALAPEGESRYGESRRGFFGQATSVAKTAAGKTVDHVLSSGVAKSVPTLRDMLAVDDSGVMPQVDAVRHASLLDAMAELGEPVADELFTRRFGSVEIDRDECNSCAMCTVFCPTHALAKSSDEPSEKGGIVIEFSAMQCVQCGLCEDVCLKGCLTVSPAVSTDQLFDFEPRVFDLPKPAAGKSHFACR